MRTLVYPIILLIAFIFITMPVSVTSFQSSTPYSIYNRGWNGLYDFKELARKYGNIKAILEPLDKYNLKSKTGVLFIIGPNLTYTSSELGQIKAFVKKGNVLVLADDFGDGNKILRSLGIKERFSQYPLEDFFYSKDDRFIIIAHIVNPVLAKNVSYILTDKPSAILVTSKGEVYSSKVAMINSKMGRYPLMVSIPYQKGKIILISDPDIFINMLYPHNKAFLKNLMSYIGPGTYYFDEIHHPNFNLYSQTSMIVNRTIPRDLAKKILLAAGGFIILLESNVIELGLRKIKKAIRRGKRWIYSQK